MVSESRRISGRKVILAFGVAILIFGLFVVDRLIYLRSIMWSAAVLDGIGTVYFGCETPIEIKEPVTGEWLIQKCNPKAPADFIRRAREVTVFPAGCLDKSVTAWGIELHYWAERWMPFAPHAGRYVFFADKSRKFVSASEFSAFGCPKE